MNPPSILKVAICALLVFGGATAGNAQDIFGKCARPNEDCKRPIKPKADACMDRCSDESETCIDDCLAISKQEAARCLGLYKECVTKVSKDVKVCEDASEKCEQRSQQSRSKCGVDCGSEASCVSVCDASNLNEVKECAFQKKNCVAGAITTAPTSGLIGCFGGCIPPKTCNFDKHKCE